MIPGEYFLKSGNIKINENRPITKIAVTNKGDRPVQVGSHYHFFEVNPMLDFDRESTRGKRLNIPAATAVRFEPGEEKEIELVSFGGEQTVYGFQNRVNGSVK